MREDHLVSHFLGEQNVERGRRREEMRRRRGRREESQERYGSLVFLYGNYDFGMDFSMEVWVFMD